MRRQLVLGLVLCIAAAGCTRNAGQVAQSPAPVQISSPVPTVDESPSPPPPPIELEGTVNHLATVDLTGSGAAVELDMALTDFAFNPTFVKVAPGANVRLALKNAGELADHTFTVDSLGVDRQLKPGEEAEVVVQLPAEGAFRFYCRLHVDRGMQGAIFFNEGDPVSTATVAPPPSGRSSAARTSTTRRSSGSATNTPARSSSEVSEDLHVPDVVINEPNSSRGRDERSADGEPGQPGSRGAPGVAGGKGMEIEVP
ncbi:MAG TPA: cupredoxin domain-containing protein [Actinomycetota bacterium]|nr:cupredoxin domain-containing protein [Actinomycetota bacterium]